MFFSQSLTEDVSRQTEREKELQARYDKLNYDLQNLQMDQQIAENNTATQGEWVDHGAMNGVDNVTPIDT